MLFFGLLLLLVPVNCQFQNDTDKFSNLGPCTNKNHLVLAPGVLTAGGTNRVCISRFFTKESAEFTLKLFPKENANLTTTATRKLVPGDGGCVDINVPALTNTKIDLIVSMRYPDSDCTWERTISLRISSGRVLVVQIERARYRPGDTVRVRLLALKPDPAPSHGILEEAWLEGPRGSWEGTRVAQWMRIRTRLGLAQFQYQLDTLAPPGKWTLRARMGDGSQASANFWVGNYELPPFQLSVKHDPKVLRTVDRLSWTVCVRYPWSEAVEGMLVIRLHGTGVGLRTAVQLRAPKACHRHAIASKRIGLQSPESLDVLVADFSFQEEGTRIWQNTTVVSQVVDKPVTIEFLTRPHSVISPGLPYTIKVKAIRWDDKPAAKEKLHVCRYPHQQNEDTKKSDICLDSETDANGIARTTFPAVQRNNLFYEFKAILTREPSVHQSVRLSASADTRVSAALGTLRGGPGAGRALVPLYINAHITTPITVHFVVITRGGIIYRWGATTQCLSTNPSDQIYGAQRNGKCNDIYYSYNRDQSLLNFTKESDMEYYDEPSKPIPRFKRKFEGGSGKWISGFVAKYDDNAIRQFNNVDEITEATRQTENTPVTADDMLETKSMEKTESTLGTESTQETESTTEQYTETESTQNTQMTTTPTNIEDTESTQIETTNETEPAIETYTFQTTEPEPTEPIKLTKLSEKLTGIKLRETPPLEYKHRINLESQNKGKSKTSAIDTKINFVELPKPKKQRSETSSMPNDVISYFDTMKNISNDEKNKPDVLNLNLTKLLERKLKVLLPIKVSHQMCPDSHLIAYFYYNGELVSASKHFEMEECFPNKVEVSWQNRQVQPGSPVSLKVSTPGPALCALTVLDVASKWVQPPPSTKDLFLANVRRLIESHRNLTEYDAAGECFYSSDVPQKLKTSLELTTFWLASAGVRLLGGQPKNNFVQCQNDARPEDMITEDVAPRADFSEAWLWHLMPIGINGTGTAMAQAPDSITRFEASATCVSRNGIAVSAPTMLQVFREFFIHADGPKRLRRGDSSIIRYRIFNYLYEELSVQIDIITDPHLSIPNARVETACIKARSSISRRVTIKAVMAAPARLILRAKAVNNDNCHYTNTTRVNSPMVSDEVIIKITIDPEGVPVHEQKSILLCAKGTSDSASKSEVEWTWPLVNAVPGTETLTVWTVGDVTGPMLADAESLILIPRGCGEQNMAQLAMNMLALTQLDPTSISALTAREHVARGFTRQLQYIHPSGGFSAFGPSDATSSTWLTAFSVKHLRRIHKFLWPSLEIPPALKNAEKWLTTQLMENGCFRNEGQVFHRELRGGLNEEGEIASVALTAYVVIALIESNPPVSPQILHNSLACLRALHPTKSRAGVYAHALIAYAFMRISKYEQILKKKNRANLVGLQEDEAVRKVLDLLHLASRSDDYVWWEAGSLATSIEATSHALLAIRASPIAVLARGGSGDAAGALRWLAAHRGVSGGFVSTQDTLVALEALTAWSPTHSLTNLNVTARCDNIAQTVQLIPDAKIPDVMKLHPGEQLTVAVEGTGCALVQATRSYNTLTPKSSTNKIMSVQVAVHTDGPFDCDENNVTCSCAAVIEVCVMWSYIFPEMALLEVYLPGGYGADAQLLYSQLQNSNTLLRRIELTPTNTKATFYMASRDGSDTGQGGGHECYSVHAVGPRIRTKAAFARVIDYYSPSHNDTQMFTIPEECPPRITQETTQYVATVNLFTEDLTTTTSSTMETSDYNLINLDDPLYIKQTKKMIQEKEDLISTPNTVDITVLVDKDNKSIQNFTVIEDFDEEAYTEPPTSTEAQEKYEPTQPTELETDRVSEFNAVPTPTELSLQFRVVPPTSEIASQFRTVPLSSEMASKYKVVPPPPEATHFSTVPSPSELPSHFSSVPPTSSKLAPPSRTIPPTSENPVQQPPSSDSPVEESPSMKAKTMNDFLKTAFQPYGPMKTLQYWRKDGGTLWLQVNVLTANSFNCNDMASSNACTVFVMPCVIWNRSLPELMLIEVYLPPQYIPDNELLYSQLGQNSSFLRRVRVNATTNRVDLYLMNKNNLADWGSGQHHQCYSIPAVGPQNGNKTGTAKLLVYNSRIYNNRQTFKIPADCTCVENEATDKLPTIPTYRLIVKDTENQQEPLADIDTEEIPKNPIVDAFTESIVDNMMSPYDIHKKYVKTDRPKFNLPDETGKELDEHWNMNKMLMNDKLSRRPAKNIKVLKDTETIKDSVIANPTETPYKSLFTLQVEQSNAAKIVSQVDNTKTDEDNPNLSNFHVIYSDKDLDVPSGIEGPVPVVVLPPTNFLPPHITRNTHSENVPEPPPHNFDPQPAIATRRLYNNAPAMPPPHRFQPPQRMSTQILNTNKALYSHKRYNFRRPYFITKPNGAYYIFPRS